MGEQLQNHKYNAAEHSTEEPKAMAVASVHHSTSTTISLKDEDETHQTIEEQFEADIRACGPDELGHRKALIRRYKQYQYMNLPNAELAAILAAIKALPIRDNRRVELHDKFSKLSESSTASLRFGDVGHGYDFCKEEGDNMFTGADSKNLDDLEQHVTGDGTEVEEGVAKLDLECQEGPLLDGASAAEVNDIKTIKGTIFNDFVGNTAKGKNSHKDENIDHAAPAMPGWYETFNRFLWAMAIG